MLLGWILGELWARVCKALQQAGKGAACHYQLLCTNADTPSIQGGQLWENSDVAATSHCALLDYFVFALWSFFTLSNRQHDCNVMLWLQTALSYWKMNCLRAFSLSPELFPVKTRKAGISMWFWSSEFWCTMESCLCVHSLLLLIPSSVISNVFRNLIFKVLYLLTWVPFCGHYSPVGNAMQVWNVCRQDREKYICELLQMRVWLLHLELTDVFCLFICQILTLSNTVCIWRFVGNYVGCAAWVKLLAHLLSSGSVAQPSAHLYWC